MSKVLFSHQSYCLSQYEDRMQFFLAKRQLMPQAITGPFFLNYFMSFLVVEFSPYSHQFLAISISKPKCMIDSPQIRHDFFFQLGNTWCCKGLWEVFFIFHFNQFLGFGYLLLYLWHLKKDVFIQRYYSIQPNLWMQLCWTSGHSTLQLIFKFLILFI